MSNKKKYIVCALTLCAIGAVSAGLIALTNEITHDIIIENENKMVKKETMAGEYLNNNSIKYTKRNKNLISSHTTHYTRVESSSSSGGGSFSSHSGSSGGGHGGGSGRHG